MPLIRRTLSLMLVLPALALGGAVFAAEPAQKAEPLSAEQLTQMMHDFPGPEFAEANRQRNEALHASLMGADFETVVKPKLLAFADEYARVTGGDVKAMEAHVLEVGAQMAEMAKDPDFKARLAGLHGGH